MTLIDQFVVSKVTLNNTNKQAIVIVVPARVHLSTSQNRKRKKRDALDTNRNLQHNLGKLLETERHVQIDDD